MAIVLKKLIYHYSYTLSLHYTVLYGHGWEDRNLKYIRETLSDWSESSYFKVTKDQNRLKEIKKEVKKEFQRKRYKSWDCSSMV